MTDENNKKPCCDTDKPDSDNKTEATTENVSHMHTESPQKTGIAAYWPLIAMAGVTILASAVLVAAGVPFMNSFMGLFFVLFALFKFFDLAGFADGFQTYDLVAKKFRAYAFAYPFMELLLGLAYLGGFTPVITYGATVILMSISVAGVINGIASGQKVQCACLGTILKVPLRGRCEIKYYRGKF
jgi:hypothetical protein